MLSLNWVELLTEYGDPTEKKGVSIGLVQRFPKYAEFWGRYVFFSRDASDPSKLRADIPPELEDIFNSHYGVFYQLTTALYQLKDLYNPLITTATPFYHLGAVIDLVERTFVMAAKAKGDLIILKLEDEDYASVVEKFWKKQYKKSFENFTSKYRPVTINLHNLSELFKQFVPEGNEFLKVSNVIRHYRNTLIHSLHPLRLVSQGKVYVPREEFLHLYADARWSSGRNNINPEHYAPVERILQELTSELITNLDTLWEILLKWMTEILPQNDQEFLHQYLLRFTSPASDAIPQRRTGWSCPSLVEGEKENFKINGVPQNREG